jgi:hypothetical protein
MRLEAASHSDIDVIARQEACFLYSATINEELHDLPSPKASDIELG